MAVFPPVRTLVGFPYAATPTVTIGESFDVHYPISNLVDGSARRTWRSGWGNVAVTLTLPSALPANFLAVFGHNLDHTQVVAVSSNTGFLRGVGARDPAFWLDLRDLAGNPTTATAWTILISANSQPVALNEIAIGLAAEFEGIITAPYAEQILSYQLRETLEYGKVYISAPGTIGRTMALALSPTVANRAALAAIDATAFSLDISKRVVVVPDSRVNDVWFVDWPSYRPTTFPESLLVTTTNLELREETMGVVRDVLP